MHEPAEELFGDYRLMSRIGQGGMGEVHLALQRTAAGTDRKIALKRILPRDAEDPESVRMFLLEMRLVGQLTHPHIAHTFDFGRIADHYFIAMEYVDGVALTRLLSHRRPAGLPLEHALRITIDLCAALHHAHELRDDAGELLGVVHRDVSPPNVLISQEGSVKLVDFGIARVPGWTHQMRTQNMKGKVAYMAPEQAESAPRVDRRADVFALGALLYEMVTGTSAFRGADFAATLLALHTADPPPLGTRRAGVPEALQMIVSRALAKSADERFQTAIEMQLELERCAAQHGIVTSAVLLSREVQLVRGREPAPVPTDMVLTRIRELGAPALPALALEPTAIDVELTPSAPMRTDLAEPLPASSVLALTPSATHSARSRTWFWAGIPILCTALAIAAIVAVRPILQQFGQGSPQAAVAAPQSATSIPPAAATPALVPRTAATPAPVPRTAQAEPGATTVQAPPAATAVPIDPPLARASHRQAPGDSSNRRDVDDAATEATGRLLLVTVPDATVRFRGRVICETPCTTPPLPAGRQILALVLRDGRRFSRTVEVPPNAVGRLRILLQE